jgi:hypothetical protein
MDIAKKTMKIDAELFFCFAGRKLGRVNSLDIVPVT